MRPVEATWLYGRHTLPSWAIDRTAPQTIVQTPGDPTWTRVAGQSIRVETKIPVVLYLHGCTGFTPQDDTYRNLLVSAGYAVLMPDSFQRPDRKKCNAQGTLSERVHLRTEEIELALARIRKLPWVDPNRIVLMGYSEGGNAVDSWSKSGFTAQLVLSSACTLVHGVPAAPANVPVLAVVGEKDDYRPGQSCRIDRTIGGSKSVVIAGGPHGIAEYPQTQEAIREFLAQCCAPEQAKALSSGKSIDPEN